MRIESLEVQNLKVLRHLKLDEIPNLVVIAGPNGSGKTSLFDAIRVLKRPLAHTHYNIEIQSIEIS